MKTSILSCLLFFASAVAAQQHYAKSWSGSMAYVWNPSRNTYGLALKGHYHTSAFNEVRVTLVMKKDFIRTNTKSQVLGSSRVVIPLSTYSLGLAYGNSFRIDSLINLYTIAGIEVGTEVINGSQRERAGYFISTKLDGFLFGPVLKAEVEIVATPYITLFTSFTQKFLFFSPTGLARVELQSGIRYYL